MDKIDIEEFSEEIIYWWFCPTCKHQNEETENPKDLEAVFCTECGNTFKIINK